MCALCQESFCDRDRTENIGVHGNANQNGQEHAKGVIAAEDGLNPAFRNPVVNNCTNANAYQDIREHFLKCADNLIFRKDYTISFCEGRRIYIYATGVSDKLLNIRL